MDMLQLDRQVCFALYNAQRAMVQAYAPLLERLSVTYPQYLVLLCLWERDGRSVGELGERLHLDSGTLSPLLQRLEARGLLQRRRSAEDERRVAAFLTPAGRKLKAKARAVPKAVLRCAGLDLKGASNLRAELQELSHQLQSPLHQSSHHPQRQSRESTK
jgi:DNA-binding MarR family transcriptional regulator